MKNEHLKRDLLLSWEFITQGPDSKRNLVPYKHRFISWCRRGESYEMLEEYDENQKDFELHNFLS